MRIKLSELLDVEKPLGELLSQDLPIKLSYRLSKLVKKVGSELKEFYDSRDRLIKKLGTESEPGKMDWSISPDNKEAIVEFQSKIKELLEMEVDLYNFEPMSINEFSGADIKISPVQMAQLHQFFVE